ncbi:MAG: hypothetical protein KA963_04625, partial [Candidatus Cloacimonas sp.]|nr:hypothetical protein [Candidatus Cloacimonas sp.]
PGRNSSVYVSIFFACLRPIRQIDYMNCVAYSKEEITTLLFPPHFLGQNKNLTKSGIINFKIISGF